MTTYCSSPHPLEPDLFCNRARSNHRDHSAYSLVAFEYVDWPNLDYVEPPEQAAKRAQSEAKATLRQIASRTKALKAQAGESI